MAIRPIPVQNANLVTTTSRGPMSVSVKTHDGRIEVDYEDIKARIERILPTLVSIYEANIEAIESKTGIWMIPTLWPSGTILDLASMQVADTLSFKDNSDLFDLINTSKRFLSDSTADKQARDTPFVYDVRVSTQAYYRFEISSVINSAQCPQCRGLYTTGGMTSHVGSLRCLRDAQCLDVADAGYVIMDDSTAVAAIRKAGVDFKVRPQALDMWVPEWVATAVKDYRKNRAFAGLKLHEFLKAVKGTD